MQLQLAIDQQVLVRAQHRLLKEIGHADKVHRVQLRRAGLHHAFRAACGATKEEFVAAWIPHGEARRRPVRSARSAVTEHGGVRPALTRVEWLNAVRMPSATPRSKLRSRPLCIQKSKINERTTFSRTRRGRQIHDRVPLERRCLAERAPLPPPEPRAHTRGVVEVAALQCEHELALLHLLEADRARVVERLRERLPVAKLRQPVRGGALLQHDRLSLPFLGARRTEARRVARVLPGARPPG